MIWKNKIEQIIPKLSGLSYAVRSMVCISNTLNLIYYVYFSSVITYGIFFVGNSSNSWKIFTVHKEIVRIMAGEALRTSWSSLIKQLEIVIVPCLYIL
jgi:hypothetical protein